MDNSKIGVVIAVIVVIVAGLAAFLFRLDYRIRKIEKKRNTD